MTIIYLRFCQTPAAEESITLVTEVLQKINPELSESERTENAITFTSPDHLVDVYGDIFQSWLESDPPVIGTWRMLAHS